IAKCPDLLVQFARAALLAGRCCSGSIATFCEDAHAAARLRRQWGRTGTAGSPARTAGSATKPARTTAPWRRRLEGVGKAHDVGADGFGLFDAQCLLERQHTAFSEHAIDDHCLEGRVTVQIWRVAQVGEAAHLPPALV